MGRLDGKVAVITGAASGVGEGTARLFVAEGARCVLVDMRAEAGHWLAAELDGSVVFVQADVSEESEVAGAVAAALAAYGRLDCVVNNAGILGAVGPIADTPAREWTRTMDVVLNSVFYGIKYAARAMTTQRSGSIINVASTAGVRAGLGPHAYTTAHHAVIGLTQSAASELGRLGIRVNALAPGATTSDLPCAGVDGQTTLGALGQRLDRAAPLEGPGVPRDIANAALWLASEESGWVNGAVLVIDAGGEVIGDRNQRFFAMDAQIVQEAGRTGL
jgi:NAD(P)-dependent dehydrogenase (short-subunit alcohol dehydrogenase family)